MYKRQARIQCKWYLIFNQWRPTNRDILTSDVKHMLWNASSIWKRSHEVDWRKIVCFFNERVPKLSICLLSLTTERLAKAKYIYFIFIVTVVSTKRTNANEVFHDLITSKIAWVCLVCLWTIINLVLLLVTCKPRSSIVLYSFIIISSSVFESSLWRQYRQRTLGYWPFFLIGISSSKS